MERYQVRWGVVSHPSIVCPLMPDDGRGPTACSLERHGLRGDRALCGETGELRDARHRGVPAHASPLGAPSPSPLKWSQARRAPTAPRPLSRSPHVQALLRRARSRLHAGVRRPVRVLPARPPRRRRDQDRAAGRRRHALRTAEQGLGRQGPRNGVALDQRQQAQHRARSVEARGDRGREAARRQGRRRHGEFPARRDGQARHRLRGALRRQPAPHLRGRVRFRPHGAGEAHRRLRRQDRR